MPRIRYEAPDGQADTYKPVGECKTCCWLRGLQDCSELAVELDGVRQVAVMDREAEVFSLFVKRHRPGTVDLLVRAKHNRSLRQGVPKLFGEVRAAPAQACLEIPAERSSAPRGSRGQKARVKFRLTT